MTFRYILPDTPKMIYDSTLVETGTAVDVFELTIGSLVYSPSSVVDDLVEQAWERFGNRPIGDYEYEHWIPIFADAVKYNWRWYSKALPTILGEDMADIEENVMTSTEIESVDNVNTGTTVVDASGTNTGTTANTGTVGVSGTFTNTNSGSVVQAQESMPDTASPSNYLAGRVTTTDTTALGNSHADTTTNNLTQTNNLSNTEDSETTNNSTASTDRNKTNVSKNKVRKNVTITLEMVKELEELNDLYLSRLDKYFMNRW